MFFKILRGSIASVIHLYHYVVVILVFTGFFVVNNGFTRISGTILLRRQQKYNEQNILQTTISNKSSNNNSTKTNIPTKYILLWTNPNKYPFIYFGEGNSLFVNKSCKWSNCYVTSNRNFLGAYTEFDVIAFNGPQVPLLLLTNDMPKDRSFHQKYVFANIEAAANYPLRTNKLNGFFNWTWTYKLDSDASWGYIVIRDKNNKIIGPQNNMHWLNVKDMDPIDYDFQSRLHSKTNAAAWFTSNCETSSLREEFVKKIQHYLKDFHLKIDVYGDCGDHQCPKKFMPRCNRAIQKHYYFYLAFENSLSEDYVTEKILHGLNNDAVPIVYGGANYTRFMPDGIYLDALKLGPKVLAHKMHDIINDPATYHNFFRWRNYYSFHLKHENPETDDYCHFCEMINNETLMNTYTVYENFSAWWMSDVKEGSVFK